MVSLLAHYTSLASRKSDDALAYAISDIKRAWFANPDFERGVTDYSKKLWAEWDAYTVELQKRRAVK
jgi:hypothetical protein|tara:strand:+ start:122 stop:322 length:201 start_codon:yes stop_codon:yes gene_type:complete